MSECFDAVIVGGGPAGATCALWLKMLGYRPLIVERRPAIGGLQAESPYVNQWVPMLAEGTRGVDVAAAMHATLLRHEVPMMLGHPVNAVRKTAKGFEISTAIGVARGTHLVLASGVGPEDGGLCSSESILIGPGHGVDSADFNGQSVAVLGGGDNAFENYLFIRERGAAAVNIFARTLRARAEFVAKVPRQDVVIGPYVVDPDRGEVGGRRFDRLVVLYGWRAQLPDMPGLKPSLDQRGFVRTNENCETSLTNVFAIGEVAKRAHPCSITSMADGVVAAKEIQCRLDMLAGVNDSVRAQ